MKCCLSEGLKTGWKYFIRVVLYHVSICTSMYRYWLPSVFKHHGNTSTKILNLNLKTSYWNIKIQSYFLKDQERNIPYKYPSCAEEGKHKGIE